VPSDARDGQRPQLRAGNASRTRAIIARMSLVQLLDNPGPVREWFEARFPATHTVSRDANRVLRDGAMETDARCPVATPAGSDFTLVGHAVGYVLSAHLREHAVHESAAVWGAARLMRHATYRGVSPEAVERLAVARIDELAPHRRTLSISE
jgi:hypothetical protein